MAVSTAQCGSDVVRPRQGQAGGARPGGRSQLVRCSPLPPDRYRLLRLRLLPAAIRIVARNSQGERPIAERRVNPAAHKPSMPLVNGIYGHGSVLALSKSKELSFTRGSTGLPAHDRSVPCSGAADRDDRKPLTGKHNALYDFYRPPDQLRGLILLERFFNGFVTMFPSKPENIASRFVGLARCAARSP